jgi:hypothetical protein
MIMQNPCVQIDDPLNPGNNVAKSSFKFFEIKVRFWYILSSLYSMHLTTLRECSCLAVSATATTTITW